MRERPANDEDEDEDDNNKAIFSNLQSDAGCTVHKITIHAKRQRRPKPNNFPNNYPSGFNIKMRPPDAVVVSLFMSCSKNDFFFLPATMSFHRVIKQSVLERAAKLGKIVQVNCHNK